MDKVLLLRDLMSVSSYGNVHGLILKTIRINIFAVYRIVAVLLLAGDVAAVVLFAIPISRTVGIS